ncbi:MAG: HNH/ENDO VII family nuclease [Rickettsiaceae bacterium]|nr:HNH/ENDO VII family nuclease [Rickettsiaceae bacterium]
MICIIALFLAMQVSRFFIHSFIGQVYKRNLEGSTHQSAHTSTHKHNPLTIAKVGSIPADQTLQPLPYKLFNLDADNRQTNTQDSKWSYIFPENVQFVHNTQSNLDTVFFYDKKSSKDFDSNYYSIAKTQFEYFPYKITWKLPFDSSKTYEIFTRNNINWNQIRESGSQKFKGKTNLEAALMNGCAPELPGGYLVTLHHINQNNNGPIAEVTSRIHSTQNRKAHLAFHSIWGQNGRHPKYPVHHKKNKKIWYDTRKNYWKFRAALELKAQHKYSIKYDTNYKINEPSILTNIVNTEKLSKYANLTSNVSNNFSLEV